MTLPPNATPSLLPPTAAALIGPFIYFQQPPEVSRFRRRNSSLENLNEMFLNDETSDKPKEDRIVKFKDELSEEPVSSSRGRSRSKKAAKEVVKETATTSILKDSSKIKSELKPTSEQTETKPVIKSIKKAKAPLPPPTTTTLTPPLTPMTSTAPTLRLRKK